MNRPAIAVAPSTAITPPDAQHHDHGPRSQPAGSVGLPWEIVPATARCQRGFTIEDYEVAAQQFADVGDEENLHLAYQAREQASAMRAWLLLMQAHAATCGSN